MKTAIRSDRPAKEVVEIAPAKVNLTLSVGARRANGYHDLVSLMETVSLSDRLTVRVEDSLLPEIKLQISGKYPVPKDPSNLVMRAAEAFFSRTRERFPLSISLEKNIPTEAGLGGGSADAAAMLRALNRLSVHSLSPDDLSSLAAGLGADVAFCLFGGASVCRGIGDQIAPIADPSRRFYLIVMGGDRVSTGAAYAALDHARSTDSFSALFHENDRLVALARGERIPLHNDFEDVVFPLHPAVAEIKARLLSLGATDALMTGSGAAVFGLFPNADAARLAASAFPDADAFCAETVGRYYP